MKRPALWTAFTDGEGEMWSWSRLLCTLILIVSLTWGTYIVWIEKKIPDFTSVALLIGAIYGVNRVAEWKETKPDTPEPQPNQQTVNVDNR